MKRLFRFAVCMALVVLCMTAGLPFSFSAAGGFYSTAEMLLIKSHIEADAGISQYTPVQGGCCDGTYAYYALTSDGGNTVTIMKYSMKTWKLADSKSFSNVGHANDMAYNSDKDQLVIVKNKPYYNRVAILNAKTLEVIRDVELKIDIYSIAYNAKRKQYVVGISGGYNFALLDQNFKVVKKFKGVNTGYTRQGCDCDDNYIYFVQSGGNNLLAVYDYSGSLVEKIPLKDSNEVENLFHVGNSFYTAMYYYGSYVHRLGFSSSTAITYQVSYDPNGGSGEMTPSYVHYGTKTPLKKNAFQRVGYHFGGWIATRESDGKQIGYRLGSKKYEWLDPEQVYHDFYYKDEQKIATTVKFGGVSLKAKWIADYYELDYECDEGAYGFIPTQTVRYEEPHEMPENTFLKEGYVFDGYTARRDYDDRVYGYRSGSNTPEWLREQDADVPHTFMPGDTVERLTDAGRVVFTAHFRFAYTFSEDGSTLTDYSGEDLAVNIPDNGGKLTTIAEGAFRGNDTMTQMYVPASVTKIEKNAVTGCPRLKAIYFRGELPEKLDDNSFSEIGGAQIYRVVDDHAVWVGHYSSPQSLMLIRMQASAMDRRLQAKSALEKATATLSP